MIQVRRLAGLSLLALGLPLVLLAKGADTTAGTEPTAPPADAIKGITSREVKAHMTFLASDMMRGRNTASAEIKIAAEYLASHLSAYGAEPSGDFDLGRRTYFQKFPLETTTLDEAKTSLSLIIDQNGTRQVTPLQLNSDYSVFPFGLTSTEIEAPVVFAGYGTVDEADKVDDYKDLDVRNKVVLVLEGRAAVARPAGDAAKTAPRITRRSMFGGGNKTEAALKRGALAVITMRSLKEPARPITAASPNASRFLRTGFMALAKPATGIPSITFQDSARDLIARAGGLTADATIKPRALDGVKVKLNLGVNRKMEEDRNVVGIFPGSDPKLRKEVIIYSAHYDHVGVNEQGEIFNGSDDNASGTSTLLEVAEAIATGPRPKRSIAFLWVSGEEKGLLGSEWFSDHVSLPDGSKIVADINLDMVSRNDGKSVGVTPSKDHPDYSTLITDALDACKLEEMTAKFDADSFYARTDSYNFARKGIPVIFFFSGVHEDYHRPTDDTTKADFDKAARIARVAYRIGWKAAQAPNAPSKIEKKKKDDTKEKPKADAKTKVATR